ncbi:alpha/beta fold hydrolase [Chryseosolibacter indicus]|uniref:Alpha/beta hydrolase n=1 Tax=Chryseosolibacter indicus TaxID=2782351 RepID=A0ABS5VYF1_9BACT|nr:alpha/beta hydrolase [Chryseosolibacter indicus]MBT1705031.1 alpha/beta hydrolase [Chryseosolibacter indicus]
MKTKAFIFFFLLISVLAAKSQSAFQVVIKGKGQPILMFPGFGCTGAVWDDAVAELSKTHQCHVFTFAGFGNVTPIEGPWLLKIKDGVIAYVKERKLKKPILLGHSLGGTLSLWLATIEPDMFSKIIAVDALPSSAALMIPNYKGDPIPYDNPQSNMILKMDSASFAAMNARTVLYMCKNTEKQKTLIDWMNKADRKTYVYGYIDMLNLDLREAIAKIKIPVVILGAANPDRTTVEKTYKTQYEKLPSVVIHYAENSSHFLMYDQPDWFIEKLLNNIK